MTHSRLNLVLLDCDDSLRLRPCCSRFPTVDRLLAMMLDAKVKHNLLAIDAASLGLVPGLTGVSGLPEFPLACSSGHGINPQLLHCTCVSA